MPEAKTLGRTLGALAALLAPSYAAADAAPAPAAPVSEAEPALATPSESAVVSPAPAGDSETAGYAADREPDPATGSPEELPPQRGSMAFAIPDATAPVARSFHVHDGFYVRVNTGIGWVGSTWTAQGVPDTDAGGTSLALDLLLGGSPSRGVAIGGAVLGHVMLATDVEVGGEESDDEALNLLMVGPFIDGFPNPTGGWHVGGSIGLARARFSDLKGWGLGGAAWAGYDAWVGDEWSVGGLARLMLVRTSAEAEESGVSSDTDATATSFTLGFTALFH